MFGFFSHFFVGDAVIVSYSNLIMKMINQIIIQQRR